MTTIITHTQPKEIEVYGLELGEGVPLELVLIPAGEFLIGRADSEEGDDDEIPQHNIKVEKPFLLAQTPVTQKQWRVVAGWPSVAMDLKDPDPSRFKGDDLPVERVNWYEAIEFCARLHQHFKMDFRLPTEAQWEYACRAGTITPFHFGKTISTDLANYNGNYTYGAGVEGEYREQTTPVRQFSPNSWGLYDMHGNVWEWCLDPWHGSYDNKSVENELIWDKEKEDKQYELTKEKTKEHVSDKRQRVRRGGSWFIDPWDCRSASRSRYDPDIQNNGNGFRVACRFPRS